MPYTNRSLVFVWLVACILFFLAGSGAITGTWLFVLVIIALGAPALLLKRPALVVAPTPAPAP